MFTVELITLEIGRRSLEKAPVSPLVVRDVSSHLVLNNFIRQENPFNPRNLHRREVQSSREERESEITRREKGWVGEDKKKKGRESNGKLFRLQ